MSTLKITVLQQPLEWMDGAANLRFFDELLAGIDGRDLIILPEMFTTGFAMEAAKSSLPEAQVVSWLQAKAKAAHAMVAGSAALQTEKGAVNRFLLVEPNGTVHHYDKRHLFRMAGEHQHYLAGERREVIEWRGWRILHRCVTTCASRSSRVIRTIMTWRSTSLTGRHRARCTGRRCCRRGRLRIRRMLPAVTASARTATVISTAATAGLSARWVRYSLPVNRISQRGSMPTCRWRTCANTVRSSRHGAMRTALVSNFVRGHGPVSEAIGPDDIQRLRLPG